MLLGKKIPAYNYICQSCKLLGRTGRRRADIHILGSNQFMSSGPPWNILYYGSDDFSKRQLEVIHQERLLNGTLINRLNVVTTSKRCPVYKYAEKHNLELVKWPHDPLPTGYDVGIVVSFGHLIPSAVIQTFPRGMINVHPSLLPRWRGAAPMIHTILAGDKTTGVSLMKITPHKFDIGPVLIQKSVQVEPAWTHSQLSAQLAKEGSNMLLHYLGDIDNIEEQAVSQGSDGVTHAHKVLPQHAVINWHQQSCDDIHRQYRAFQGVFELKSLFGSIPVRLKDMMSPSQFQELGIAKSIPKYHPEPVEPGTPCFHKPSATLCIKCKDGWVGFQQIQIKKWISAKAFYNGYLSKQEYNTYKDTNFKSMDNELYEYFPVKEL